VPKVSAKVAPGFQVDVFWRPTQYCRMNSGGERFPEFCGAMSVRCQIRPDYIVTQIFPKWAPACMRASAAGTSSNG
jgi:hypothetical protein